MDIRIRTRVCLAPTNTTTTTLHSLLPFKRWLDKKLTSNRGTIPFFNPHPFKLCLWFNLPQSPCISQVLLSSGADIKECWFLQLVWQKAQQFLASGAFSQALIDPSITCVHWHIFLERGLPVLIRFWKVCNSLKAITILEDGRKHRI